MLLILKEEGTQQTVLFDIIGLFLSLNFQETLNFIANTDVWEGLCLLQLSIPIYILFGLLFYLCMYITLD